MIKLAESWNPSFAVTGLTRVSSNVQRLLSPQREVLCGTTCSRLRSEIAKNSAAAASKWDKRVLCQLLWNETIKFDEMTVCASSNSRERTEEWPCRPPLPHSLHHNCYTIPLNPLLFLFTIFPAAPRSSTTTTHLSDQTTNGRFRCQLFRWLFRAFSFHPWGRMELADLIAVSSASFHRTGQWL